MKLAIIKAEKNVRNATGGYNQVYDRTLAELVLMDSTGSKNIKEYVDENIQEHGGTQVNFETSTSNIKANGAVAVGTLPTVPRADHVHPTDSTRAPLVSPTLTGTPTAPTAATANNSTQIATTAFVKAQGYLTSAPVASVNGKTGTVTLTASDVGAEPTITTGTTSQYRRGDKTWQDFATAVRAAVLTGLSTATNAAVTASDTVLSAIGKLQAQINARLLPENIKPGSNVTVSTSGNNVTINATGTTFYGTCSSMPSQVEKVVVATGFSATIGNRIVVKWTYVNSAINPTLNVNGTGAYPIYWNNTRITNTPNILRADAVNEFAFTGGRYDMITDESKIPLSGGQLTGPLYAFPSDTDYATYRMRNVAIGNGLVPDTLHNGYIALVY